MFVVGFNKSTIERAMKLIDEYDFLYGIIVGIQLTQLIYRRTLGMD
ncbi:Putative deoxyribonuclease YcfH [Staphylococcus aureus]|uniref:Deoxyribonuclease YcfH n=1 Tax=Staphylococcus aureus TaxID=1280 RepID=A0A380DL95_STAAU|nr:Putative deoxyribonuclease YcfH [Staphylococcus aureus]